jgi:hypothetical protein
MEEPYLQMLHGLRLYGSYNVPGRAYSGVLANLTRLLGRGANLNKADGRTDLFSLAVAIT